MWAASSGFSSCLCPSWEKKTRVKVSAANTWHRARIEARVVNGKMERWGEGERTSHLIHGNKVGRGWWRVGPGNAILSQSELGLKFSCQLVSSVCCLLGRFTNHWLISWTAPAVKVRLMHIHIGQCIKPFAIIRYWRSIAPDVCRLQVVHLRYRRYF